MSELQKAVNGDVSIQVSAPALVVQPPANSPPSDALLIALICRRHEHSLGILYDRYSRLLYTIALRITGDRNVTEEVIQDVFSAVWQSAESFHIDGNVKAWLIGITRHRAIDATRARHVRAQNATMALDELHTLSSADETEAQVITLLENEQIQQALADLPPTQRSAIELAYYAGLTCVEIAERTGAPIGTVKTRLRLGISRLRTLLLGDPRAV